MTRSNVMLQTVALRKHKTNTSQNQYRTSTSTDAAFCSVGQRTCYRIFISVPQSAYTSVMTLSQQSVLQPGVSEDNIGVHKTIFRGS
jgi:hypothetical protein